MYIFKMMEKRSLFLGTLLLIFSSNGLTQDRPSVGAIRWDAWLGHGNAIGSALNKSLRPIHYHSRLPFFANVVNSDSINIDGNSQEVLDQEIEYASHSNLDYFAFLMYDEDYLLSNGLKNYLTSAKKALINFCVIMNDIDTTTESITYSVQRTLNYIQEPTYQTVLDGRPLVYTFRLRNKPDFAEELKDSCAAKGLKEPYIVDLHWNDAMPNNTVYDAISRYWYDGSSFSGSASGAPYSNLMSAAQTNWQTRATNGAQQVPLVSLGADGRPRIENPVPWIDDPVSLYEKYFDSPTPNEITTHLKQAFNFIEDNPNSCQANTALIYAWNENDEGGWLIPTLNPNSYEINTDRIDTLRTFLSNYTSPLNTPNTHDSALTGVISGSTFGDPNELPANLAFDGLTTTYSDVFRTQGFLQMEFDEFIELSLIRFYPRQGYHTRLENAIFQTSADGENWIDQHTLNYVPAANEWTEIDLPQNTIAKYARLFHPTNWLTIAEIEFIEQEEIITANIVDYNVKKANILYSQITNTTITINKNGRYNLSILGIDGNQKIHKEALRNISTVDISSLSSGSYILIIKSTEGIQTARIIKL